jgi:hypothetical protein
MQKIEITLPAVVNNVVITEDLLKTIDSIQTGGCYWQQYEDKVHNETILNEKIADCKHLLVYMVGVIQRGESSTENREENNMLGRVYWLLDLLEEFRTPPELFIKQEPDHKQ